MYMLHIVAVCCSVLQCVAVFGRVLHVYVGFRIDMEKIIQSVCAGAMQMCVCMCVCGCVCVCVCVCV